MLHTFPEMDVKLLHYYVSEISTQTLIIAAGGKPCSLSVSFLLKSIL